MLRAHSKRKSTSHNTYFRIIMKISLEKDDPYKSAATLEQYSVLK